MKKSNGSALAKANGKKRPRFRKWYRHYRTGKLMFAEDYGYKAWPF